MKRTVFGSALILMLAVILVSGCESKSSGRARQKYFNSTLCSGTKASDEGTEPGSSRCTLNLKYTNGALAVSLLNFPAGCEVKEGLDCRTVLEGSTLSIYVTQKSTHSANCICVVDKTETKVTGLSKGKYSLVYYYCSAMGNISQRVDFEFSKDLDMSVGFLPY